MKPTSACIPCKDYVNGICKKQEIIDALGWCPEFASRYIEKITGASK
jgi:hypothetical protein